MTELSRPVLRWHGGKWRLAPWIIAHFPPHRVYAEPFGGGGSVLLRKSRSYAEVYNDLDNEIVTLFRVARDDIASTRLVKLLEATPFARAEFEAAYEPCLDEIERSRRLLIRSFMGFGSDGSISEWKTGFRANSNRSGTTPARDWMNYPAAFAAIIERLRGVVVENRDAVKVMAAHDGPNTLHYVDPPYVHETRSPKRRRKGGSYVAAYRFDRTVLAFLKRLSGMVVLSGYPCPLYETSLHGWQRMECRALADGARSRTEVLWLNPHCSDRLRSKGPLFEAVA